MKELLLKVENFALGYGAEDVKVDYIIYEDEEIEIIVYVKNVDKIKLEKALYDTYGTESIYFNVL